MKMPEPWELTAGERARNADALSTPAMRSWSRSFRARALWNRYVQCWREAKAVAEYVQPPEPNP